MRTIRRFSAPLILVWISLAILVGIHAQGQTATPPHITTLPSDSSNYENVPVNMVIDILEQLSGKKYIRDSNLYGVPPITVKAGGLSKDETVKLITATLLLNGVAILPVDDHTMKVVTDGTNKNPRSEGVRAYTDEADLPADDEIVTYYMQFDHISSQEAAGIFTQVAPVHTYGSYVPAPSSNGLILTENVSVIRELIALKKVIDANNPGAPRPAPPAPPSHPPGPGPRHPGGGMVVFAILILLSAAAGNFFARLWLARKPRP
jgi:hypothetical protein